MEVALIPGFSCLAEGKEVPVTEIPLSGGRGRAIIETKTGRGELSNNQDTVYNSVANGGVTGAGKNAQQAELLGPVPADTPVIILRPNE